MRPLSECRLYALVDAGYLHGRPPELVAQQLCDGGSDLIQLRAKSSTPDEVRRLVDLILPVTERAGIGLVVNDHLSVALAARAPFCHLGQEDFFDAGHTHVSQLKTDRAQIKIGLSTHAPAQAVRAIDAGADYLGVGPIYATGTKPTARPVTLDYVRWAAENVKIPWFAIGGINLKNLPEVLDAGAKRICVVSAILNAPDISKACKNFKELLRFAP
jgi:thiamine-phosphate pyrophosphorylase